MALIIQFTIEGLGSLNIATKFHLIALNRTKISFALCNDDFCLPNHQRELKDSCSASGQRSSKS